jgi:hypothetical protein
MRKILSPLILAGDFNEALDIILHEPHGVDSFAWFLKGREYKGFDLHSSIAVYADLPVPGQDSLRIELVCMGPWYLPLLEDRGDRSLTLCGQGALRATIKLAGSIGLSSLGVPPEWAGICDTLACDQPVRIYAEKANEGIVLA